MVADGGSGSGRGGVRLTIRSASALRFSKGCSSLNLDRIVEDVFVIIGMRGTAVLFVVM